MIGLGFETFEFDLDFSKGGKGSAFSSLRVNEP